MARSRNIKPGIFKNEVLGVADPLLTLLFEGLWVLADRAGRLEDRPLRIKAEVFPYRNAVEPDEMLNWLQGNGFIRRYKVSGVALIQIINFEKHQSPHKNESASVFPAFEEIGTTTEVLGTTRADSLLLIPDSLIPDSGLPSSEPKGSAAVEAAMTKDELWSAGKSLLEQSGMPSKQCGSFVGKLVKDYGNEIVVDAVRVAVLERPPDPAAFLKAVCQRQTGQRLPVNRQEAQESRNRNVAAQWLETNETQ